MMSRGTLLNLLRGRVTNPFGVAHYDGRGLRRPSRQCNVARNHVRMVRPKATTASLDKIAARSRIRRFHYYVS